MPRATCRCGQPLTAPANQADRVVCPRCGAKVRIRVRGEGVAAPAATMSDGFIRFFCPCGRRLKVAASDGASHGKCPDCDRVVPVPTSTVAHAARAAGHPESPTQELTAADRSTLERWVAGHRKPVPVPEPVPAAAAPATQAESVGLFDRDDFNLPTLEDLPPAPTTPPPPLPPTSSLAPMRSPAPVPSDRVEVGLRVCSLCGQPIPLGASSCRACGSPAPSR